jgi:hypothetical protein
VKKLYKAPSTRTNESRLAITEFTGVAAVVDMRRRAEDAGGVADEVVVEERMPVHWANRTYERGRDLPKGKGSREHQPPL